MLTYSVLAEKNIPVELKFWKTLFSEKPNFKKHDLYFCLPVTLPCSHHILFCLVKYSVKTHQKKWLTYYQEPTIRLCSTRFTVITS